MQKTILITGAGTGFGKATSIALAKKGHKVIATTETEKQAETLRSEVKSAGLDVTIYKLDITSPADRESIRQFDLDVLINNAAYGESGSLADINMDKVRMNFETNVFSTFELSQIALMPMLDKNKGTIIFISSLAGRITMPFLGPYSMTKFAVTSGADALRQEIHQIKKNVHISLIEPGAYHTGFNQENIGRMMHWISEESAFYPHIEKIHQQQLKRFELLESKSVHSIVRKIVKAAEAKRPLLTYSAPWWQAFGVQILRMIGK